MAAHSKPSTSWEPVSEWYASSVGTQGHYYHQHVVIPNSLRLLNVSEPDSLLDLGCGQGVLARQIPEQSYYQGIDISSSLILYAKQHDHAEEHHYHVADVSRASLPIQKKDFSKAAIILALQNIEKADQVIVNVSHHLRSNGQFLLVLNHPCFRIPRQSSWETDEQKKTQYRRIDRYYSPVKIPITMNPGKRNSAVTWSFHQPLSYYFQHLQHNGFLVETVEEWVSDKVSQGRAAKMENRGRAEFPLFLSILAKKV